MATASDPLWINASAGAPAYSARELRAAMAFLAQYPGRRIGGQPGVRPGGDQLKVSLSGSNILMEAGCALLDPAVSSVSGPYLVAFDAQQTVSTLAAPHATLVRVDIVTIKVEDNDEDASGQRRAIPVYTQGTAGSGQPATPTGHLLLASINVPQSGGGAATVTDARSFSPAGPTQVAFTASGSFTIGTYPWARAIWVRLVGGGGGGGGAGTSGAGTSAVGSGGGGGGYSERWIPVNLLAASETVTVGAAGAASAAGASNGGNGGTTSFGALLSATGGTGGLGQAATSGAVLGGGGGGAGSGGDVNINGKTGGYSRIASSGIPVSIGSGGDSLLGYGGQEAGSNSSANGVGGQLYGGGGSGGFNRDTAGTTNRSGGAGAAGIVIVTII